LWVKALKKEREGGREREVKEEETRVEGGEEVGWPVLDKQQRGCQLLYSDLFPDGPATIRCTDCSSALFIFYTIQIPYLHSLPSIFCCINRCSQPHLGGYRILLSASKGGGIKLPTANDCRSS